MYKIINEDSFVLEFLEIRPNQFSKNGLYALYNYFTEQENDVKDIELDVIAICCEYTEYSTALECADNYGYEEAVDLEPYGSLDLIEVAELEEKQALQWLKDRTSVIEFDGGIIINNF